jgi:hypothetical protein
MNTKGNVSLELLLTFMIFIIIISSVISLVNNEFDTLDETHTRRQAKEQTMKVSHIINNVYLMGNGYNEKYHLPQHINNESYVLEINSSGVYVNSHYQLTKDDIIARDIYYNNKKSKNISLTPDNTYTFTNKNGQIHIYNE